MKRINKEGQVEETRPFDNAPDEFLYYVRDRWLAALDDGEAEAGVLDDRLIAYLEHEAIQALVDRFPELPPRPVIDKDRLALVPELDRPRGKYSPRDAPKSPDTYHAARERWRSVWVVEAYHHERDSHTYPRKVSAAINILIGAARLRSAIENNDSQRAAALGMLLAFEAIGGGYALDLESEKESSKALKKARQTAYSKGIGKVATDLKKAKAACIATASSIWMLHRTQRMGKVKEACQKVILDNFELYPALDKAPTIDTIHGWLSKAEERGELVIPAEARKPGRQKE